MSTDIFGVRVLGIDQSRREVRLRVFVVYYETEGRTYLPLPERDAGFFLGLLWESGRWGGPIGQAVSSDRLRDDDWCAAHARWFVDHVERLAVRNEPQSDDDWSRLVNFYYERNGRWQDEDRLVQADYVVRVTDVRWMEHLRAGQAWGSTKYPRNADFLLPGEAPHVPDLRHPAHVLPGFSDAGFDGPVFSDNGRYLAAADKEGGQVVVYDAADWSERARIDYGPETDMPRLMWVPGRHVITVQDTESFDAPQQAYDVDAGRGTDLPVEAGFARSRTGRFRVEYGYASGVTFVGEGTGPEEARNVPLAPGGVGVQCVSFTASESRLYAGGLSRGVYGIDTATADVVEVVENVAERVWSLAVSPDGAHLAVGGPEFEHSAHEVRIVRVSDHAVVTRRTLGEYVTALAWSPDDRWLVAQVSDEAGGGIHVLPIGLPAEPPRGLLLDS